MSKQRIQGAAVSGTPKAAARMDARIRARIALDVVRGIEHLALSTDERAHLRAVLSELDTLTETMED